jgi:hypothetical protein
MNAPPSESEGSGDEDLLSGGDLFFRSEEPPSPSVGRKNRKAQHISEEDIMQVVGSIPSYVIIINCYSPAEYRVFCSLISRLLRPSISFSS